MRTVENFVCDLYSITTNQAAIAALFRVMNLYVGNLPPRRVPRRGCIAAFRVERHFSAVRGSELWASITVFCSLCSGQAIA